MTDLETALSEAVTLLYTHGVMTGAQRDSARKKLTTVKKHLTVPTCKKSLQVGGWRPISSAPFGKVIEVRNSQMDHPCLATRGYVRNGMVHENTKFCTTVFTPSPDGLFPTPSGQLVCPDEWRPAEQVSA